MSLQKFMKKDVITVTGKTSIANAAKLMKDRHVGSLVVVEKNKPVGMITDRDIVIEVVAKDQDVKKTRVENIMMRVPLTASTQDSLYSTIGKMKENGVRRIPVTNKNGKLAGLISSDDLAEFLTQELSDLSTISKNQIKKEQGHFALVS